MRPVAQSCAKLGLKFDLVLLYYVYLYTFVYACSKTGSIRDDPYRATRENSLELIDLSSTNKVSLV